MDTLADRGAMLAEPQQERLPVNEGNKIRQISIEEVDRGYIVRVDCHTFAISTKAELTTKLTESIYEPAKTEKKWYSGDLF